MRNTVFSYTGFERSLQYRKTFLNGKYHIFAGRMSDYIFKYTWSTQGVVKTPCKKLTFCALEAQIV